MMECLGVPSLYPKDIASQCYDIQAHMVRQDPAYYALLVACRPDQNWKLIHCIFSGQLEDNDFSPDEVVFGVPMDCIKPLVNGIGTSNVQSTIAFPSVSGERRVQCLPAFQRHLRRWNDEFQTPRDIGPPGKGPRIFMERNRAAFGSPQEISLVAGDLLILSPQIPRWPRTFSSSSLLNLSQVNDKSEGLMSRTTTFNFQYLRAEELRQCALFGGYPTAHVQVNKVSALGEALSGSRDWGDWKVFQECNILFGQDIGQARRYIGEVREKLAREFHKALDLIEARSTTSFRDDMQESVTPSF